MTTLHLTNTYIIIICTTAIYTALLWAKNGFHAYKNADLHALDKTDFTHTATQRVALGWDVTRFDRLTDLVC